MKKWLNCLVAVVAGALAMSAALADDDKDDGNEQAVKVEQLPSLVKATLLKEVGSGKIVELVKETKGNTITYEADVRLDGKTWELRISEDGKLVSKKLDDDDDDDGPDDDDDGPDED